MNWTKLTLLSGVALAVIAVPAADAQRNGGNRGQMRDGGPRIQSTSVNTGPARSFAGRGDRTRSGGDRSGNWRGGDRSGNWRGGDRGRWGHHHHHHHHGHRHYRPRYYSYYSGFGYPYGFGYGYGYPYSGASASLYYNGYNPQSAARGGGSVVVEVQQQLASAGYYRGTIDGVIGNGTRSAIRAYERDNGLRVDGRIDDRLLSALGVG